jgi:hypothetical protein
MSDDATTDPLAPLKACELHVHMGGCFSVDDLIELAGPCYNDIDWSPYIHAFDSAYGLRPDPADWFARAVAGDPAGKEAIRRHFVFTEEDGPDFGRFTAKFSLLIAIARHYVRHVPGGQREVACRALQRHRAEGVRYVEMRAKYTSPDDVESFLNFHRINAEAARDASGDGFEARYIPSLPRQAPGPAYDLLRGWLADEGRELYPWVLGLDFCDVEEGFPPRAAADIVHRIHADNDADPARALEILYHVGEIYFDKSLESAVRWCHEAAELGVRRLGHCIALGLDPEVAAARRGGSHARERVSERLDQIDYDTNHLKGLEEVGVEVDTAALAAEGERLRGRDPDRLLHRAYDEHRFEQVRRRQTYALREIARMGAVIESCPSSNLRLGSVPSPDLHPVHRFIRSDVDLVIGADDPGIFDSPLRDEVDWVVESTHLTPQALFGRLGDPLRHRLGRLREGAS